MGKSGISTQLVILRKAVLDMQSFNLICYSCGWNRELDSVSCAQWNVYNVPYRQLMQAHLLRNTYISYRQGWLNENSRDKTIIYDYVFWGNLMFPTLQSTVLWVPTTHWSITPVKAAGLDPTRMRKDSWNAKVVHLVVTLSIYTPGASQNAKVRTSSFSDSHLWLASAIPLVFITGMRLTCEMRISPNWPCVHVKRKGHIFTTSVACTMFRQIL